MSILDEVENPIQTKRLWCHAPYIHSFDGGKDGANRRVN